MVEGSSSTKGFKIPRVGLFGRVPKRETLPNISNNGIGFQGGKGYRKVIDKNGTPVIDTTGSSFLNERDFIYPALMILLAPYVAPLSEKLLNEIFIAGKKFVGVALHLVKEIGVLFKFSYDEMMKKIGPSANFVLSVVSQTRGMIQDNIYKLKLFLQKFPKFLRGIFLSLEKFCGDACKLASNEMKNLCTCLSRTKESVNSFVCHVVSSVSDAVIIAFKETKSIFVLFASVLATGVESSSKFCVYSMSYVIEGVVSTWDMISSFVAESSEKISNIIVLSFYNSYYFLEETSGFIVDAITTVFECTGNTVKCVVRNIFSCMAYVVDGIPQCFDNFCRAMPFLEKSDNGFALTKKTQSLVYVASVIGSLYPHLQNDVAIIASTRVGNLFMLGSLARGIHLSTSLVFAVQPTLGFGALVNIGAMLSKKLSITYFMAGWFLSSNIWKFFGTKTPPVIIYGTNEDKLHRKKWFTHGA